MSYFRASTDNPTGWRPNTIRLGDLNRGRRRVYRNRLGDPGFMCTPDGACSPCDTSTDGDGCISSGPSDADVSNAQTSIFNIGAQLQQMNQKLLADENAVRQMNASGSPASPATGQALLALRNEFESLLGKYTTAYRALFGTTPSGFSGLGNLGADPITWAIVIGFIGVAAGLIAVWLSHEANVSQQIAVDKQKAQTAGTLANQATTIQQQIVDAQARGDSAAVAQLTAQYNAVLKVIGTNSQNSTDWSSFFQNNWGWMAAGVVGLIVVSRL